MKIETMLAFIIKPDQADPEVARLEQFLEKHCYKVIRKDTIEAAIEDPRLKAHTDSLVLIPAAVASQGDVERVIRLAGQFTGHAFVIYVSDEISQTHYKALVRTGVADCVSWNSAMREIVEISRRTHARPPEPVVPSEKSKSPPTVISFSGTSGGSGNTTLAIETGICLASLKGKDARRVAVVDLDLQRTVMADYLDLAPRLDIAELIRNPERLDGYMLDIFTSKHPSNLDIFACVNSNIDICAIDGSVIFSLLDHLMDRYETILLDLPRCRMAWLDGVLMNSDLVFVTGRYSVPSVKQIVQELKHLGGELKIAQERVSVIVNHCQKQFFGRVLRNSGIDTVLANQRVFYVQHDPSFALDCVNVGASMVQTSRRRGICRDIKKISEAVVAVRPRVTP
jgi:Flp pilus assembly CpaE family ATPase